MIVIVEDSILISERLIDILESQSNLGRVAAVKNAEEFLAFLEIEIPEIILLDINLPDGNGIELLKMLRKKHPHVKVVMITNQVSDYYKQLCKKLGASHFLDKSKDFELIPKIIAELRAKN